MKLTRTTIAALLLAALPMTAGAMEIGRAGNANGGDMVFTDMDCATNSELWVMYSYSRSRKTVKTGCWTLVGNEIFVKWGDRTVSIYDFDNLTLSDEFRQTLPKR